MTSTHDAPAVTPANLFLPPRATEADATAEAEFGAKIAELKFLNTSVQYVLEELPVLTLMVDPEVQRTYLNKALISEIIADPDFSVFGTFVVSRRADGTLHIVDGQHRWLAQVELILLGKLPEDYRQPCRVFTGLTTEKEAKLFTKLNRFTDPQAIERFRISVRSKDPEALAIFALLKENGWKPEMGNTEGKFGAIVALQLAYRRNPQATARALSVLTLAWGMHPSSVNGHLVSGFAAFLDRYEDEVDDVRLIERLQSSTSASAFRGRAASLKETLPGATHADAVASMLVRTYNFRLKTQGLPLWDA